jgi:hypothetical protein
MTLPLTSPFVIGTKVTKAQLDSLVNSINALYLAPGTPRAKATTTSAQSFADSTQAILTGFTSVYSVGGMIVSTNGITVPVNGDYSVLAWQNWSTNGTVRRTMRLQVNGTDLTPFEAFPVLSLSGANTAISAASAFRLNAGDKVQITGLQTSGGALAMNGAALSVHLIGAN